MSKIKEQHMEEDKIAIANILFQLLASLGVEDRNHAVAGASLSFLYYLESVRASVRIVTIRNPDAISC